MPTTYSSTQTLPDWYTNAQQGELTNLGGAIDQASSSLTPILQAGTEDPSLIRQTNAEQNPSLDQGIFASYVDPYTSGVTNEIATLGNRNLTENVLPAVNDTFTGAGQFGGNRNSEFESRAIRDEGQDIANAQAQALETGFNTSMGGYNAAEQRALTGQQNDIAAANAAANVANVQGNVINAMKVPVGVSGQTSGPLPGAQYGPSPAAGLTSAINGLPAAYNAISGALNGSPSDINSATGNSYATDLAGGVIPMRKGGALRVVSSNDRKPKARGALKHARKAA